MSTIKSKTPATAKPKDKPWALLRDGVIKFNPNSFSFSAETSEGKIPVAEGAVRAWAQRTLSGTKARLVINAGVVVGINED